MQRYLIKGQIKYQFFLFHRLNFFSLKFVGSIFVSSIVSSHLINETPIIFAEYLSFLQLRVAGFQIDFFSRIWYSLHSHQHY